MAEAQAFEEIIEDRCENYAILSRLFRVEVDKELLGELIESPAAEAIGEPDFDEGYASLRGFLDGVTDLDKGKSQLAIDYCLTFLGYGVDPDKADDIGRNAAYPYESIYTSGIKSLGGKHCADVKEQYKAQGFMPTKGRERLASDHIAAELEFMQFLASVELSSLKGEGPMSVEEARRLQLGFATEHLLNWIDEFRQEVEAHSETEFYKGLVRMTKGWLVHDVASLRAQQEQEG